MLVCLSFSKTKSRKEVKNKTKQLQQQNKKNLYVSLQTTWNLQSFNETFKKNNTGALYKKEKLE